eukprot:2892734-Rhodomonas_salina.1
MMARSCLAGVLLATMLSHCAAFLPTGFNPSLALRASKAASVCTMVRTKFLYQDPGINCTDISTRSPHAFAASWEPSGNFVEKGCSRCHDFDIGRCRGFGAFSRLRRTVIQQHDQCRSQGVVAGNASSFYEVDIKAAIDKEDWAAVQEVRIAASQRFDAHSSHLAKQLFESANTHSQKNTRKEHFPSRCLTLRSSGTGARREGQGLSAG